MPKTAKATDLTTVLNKQVANLNVLYVKLHHFHWYVKGSSFFDLHKKFEELYVETTAEMDKVAERILAIHGKPLSTMEEYLKNATIEEAKKDEMNSGRMVEQLLEDYRTIAGELKEGIDLAEQAEDQGTADLLTEICFNVDKNIWMLEAFLSE